LYGGAGNDTLKGGEGRDYYFFSSDELTGFTKLIDDSDNIGSIGILGRPDITGAGA